MKVILGLGNPGTSYERTRHNIGFMVVDWIAAQHRVAIKKKKYQSFVGDWQPAGKKVLLVKPQTYMNHSGAAARSLCDHLRVEAKDLVVVHDDLDLPFGRIRIRQRGGGGGHRGVISILEVLGDQDFARVRVGIGRPPHGMDPADYVLEPFGSDEAAELKEIIARAAQAVEALLVEGTQRAMGKFNRAS